MPQPRIGVSALALEFSPTPAQQKLLDWVRSHPGFQTVEQLCAAAEVGESSYYRWCQDPAFRAWFTREWSSMLLFDGWHMLNLARANMVNSPTHFRCLFNLVFDPKGQRALAGWTEYAAFGVARDLSVQVLADQQNSPENGSFSELPPPTAVARTLDQNLKALGKAAA